MKFAHLADCHVGGWRDPVMTELSIAAFERAIDEVIYEKVDFVVIAGDLFNTSLPGIDMIKRVTKQLKKLKDAAIPMYFIAGSHDYSPSGKTMLDVLENAGLGVNVAKAKQHEDALQLEFTTDKKTGVKLTGILGRMGGLDKNFYQHLDRKSLEEEQGYKIFLFHALLTELKPKDLEQVDSHPLSLLPKNFNYYAGGHPHFRKVQHLPDYGKVAYTGPLFPNSFSELEELKYGGYYIVEDDHTVFKPVELKKVECFDFNAETKSAEELQQEIQHALEKADVRGKIVLLRAKGTLDQGKPSDVDFRSLFAHLKERGCYACLRNTTKLTSKEYEEVKIEVQKVDELEDSLIKEQLNNGDLDLDEKALAKELLTVLDTSKQEGERVVDFEKRLLDQLKTIIP